MSCIASTLSIGQRFSIASSGSRFSRASNRLLYGSRRRVHLVSQRNPPNPLGYQPVFALKSDGSVGFEEVDRREHAKGLRKEVQARSQERPVDQTLTIHHPDLEIDEALSLATPDDVLLTEDGSENTFTPMSTNAIPDDLYSREHLSSQHSLGELPQQITELPQWTGGRGTGREPIPAYPFRAKSTLPLPRGLPIGNLNLYNGSLIQSGFKISKGDGKVHTRRKWHPNVHMNVLWSTVLNEKVPIRTTARIRRTIKKEGGIDEYLISDGHDRLFEMGEWGWRLRWLMLMRNRAGVAKVLMKKKQDFYTSRLKAAEESKRRELRKNDKSTRDEGPTGKLTYVI